MYLTTADPAITVTKNNWLKYKAYLKNSIEGTSIHGLIDNLKWRSIAICDELPLQAHFVDGKPLSGIDICGRELWNSVDWTKHDEHVKIGEGVNGVFICRK
jgi:hypothetical protein